MIKLLVRSIDFGWGENMNYVQLSEKDLMIIYDNNGDNKIGQYLI